MHPTYTLIACDESDLAARVNENLKAGWTLWGSPAFIVRHNPQTGTERVVAYQAMITPCFTGVETVDPARVDVLLG